MVRWGAASTMAVTSAGRLARTRWWPGLLALALYGLVLLVFATYPWLDRLVRGGGRPDLALLAPFAVAPILAAFTASTVGVVLASRRPRHPVGWLLLALGLCMATSGAAVPYVPYGLVIRPGSLPAADVVARLYSPLIEAAFATLGFVLLLTPTGSPPSPRWRPWAQAGAVAMAVLLVAAALAPGSLDPNVLANAGPVNFRAMSGGTRVANQAALGASLLTVLAGATSLVVRFRHARGAERQQLRWVALAAALTGMAMVAVAVLVALDDQQLAPWFSVVATTFLPLSVGAAIMRYRLFDLDRLISRTLAYGLLTVLLGSGYALVVLGLGQLLGRDSPLVVAAATLAVAAVFQPARSRVQHVVDRRFNRRRHDADRVIEGFGARLRDQVDLDSLAAGLLEVADQTMQPTQAWLWLRHMPPHPVDGLPVLPGES